MAGKGHRCEWCLQCGKDKDMTGVYQPGVYQTGVYQPGKGTCIGGFYIACKEHRVVFIS